MKNIKHVLAFIAGVNLASGLLGNFGLSPVECFNFGAALWVAIEALIPE